jgi:AcrR family transcriptional regulator
MHAASVHTEVPPRESAAEGHRARLLAGIAAAIEEKGYAATTIGDIARQAHVSKRTFYEHFTDKEAGFMALFEAISEHLLATVARAAPPDLPPEERVRAGVTAYLSELASRPELTGTYLMEIRAAGPRALALRRRVMDRFAAIVQELSGEGGSSISAETATALVGGINELTLLAVEQQRAHELTNLSQTATDLIRAAVAQRAPAT